MGSLLCTKVRRRDSSTESLPTSPGISGRDESYRTERKETKDSSSKKRKQKSREAGQKNTDRDVQEAVEEPHGIYESLTDIPASNYDNVPRHRKLEARLEEDGINSNRTLPELSESAIKANPHMYHQLEWPNGRQPTFDHQDDTENTGTADGTVLFTDRWSHDQHAPISSTQLPIAEAVQVQDGNEEFNLTNSYAFQNQGSNTKIINNAKCKTDDEDRILSPLAYLNKLERGGIHLNSPTNQHSQLHGQLPMCTDEELSSLQTRFIPAPTDAPTYYTTAVENQLCKVQVVPHNPVVIPFHPYMEVGKFCNIVEEDYQVSCCVLDRDLSPYNKRIQLLRLTPPFIIKLGNVNNIVSRVVPGK